MLQGIKVDTVERRLWYLFQLIIVNFFKTDTWFKLSKIIQNSILLNPQMNQNEVLKKY